MKKTLLHFRRLLLVSLIAFSGNLYAQLQGQLLLGTSNCTRPLNVVITNGSGNYNIAWGVTPNTCVVPSNNSTASLPNAACSSDANYYVFVRDNVSGQIGYFTTYVPRIITGPFSVWVGNVVTPNGDGINDNLTAQAANNTSGPLNAHSYSFWVGPNPQGSNLIFTTSGNNHLGLNSGLTLWNPGNVASGTYYYELTLTNCTQSQTYRGTVRVLR